jgi:hypothetical protein
LSTVACALAFQACKADDIELRQIAKFGATQILELATEYKVEELFAVRGHELPIQDFFGPAAVPRQKLFMFLETGKNSRSFVSCIFRAQAGCLLHGKPRPFRANLWLRLGVIFWQGRSPTAQRH